MQKIYFILNSVLDSHSTKRVEDFKSYGFEVKVFGFIREKETDANTDAQILGQFPNNLSYLKRINIYLRGIKKLFNHEKDDQVIWYYLGLDVAMFAYHIAPKRRFIYEECDLVQTYTKNCLVTSLLEIVDKRIIKKSIATIMTSEGFLHYHYRGSSHPNHIVLVPNKLSRLVTEQAIVSRKELNTNSIRFSFVGGVRYHSLLVFARNLTKNFPKHEFHFYGFVSPSIAKNMLPHANNIFYHGRFRSPEDLSEIYAETDVLVCTYDTDEVNVRYAEPNKLYEAIFFNCPIIVSKNTYLEKRVNQLNIGYAVNAYNEQDVKSLVKTIERNLAEKISYMSTIDKNLALEDISYIKTIERLIK